MMQKEAIVNINKNQEEYDKFRSLSKFYGLAAGHSISMIYVRVGIFTQVMMDMFRISMMQRMQSTGK